MQEFVELAFGYADLNWKDYVRQDEEFMRPAEVDTLLGDPTKAKEQLDWKPEVSFETLVQMMVESDIKLLQDGKRK